MKVNDGQLDHANRRIAVLELSQRVLQDVCARRMELLKRVVESEIEIDQRGRIHCRLDRQVCDAIYSETAENEVQP